MWTDPGLIRLLIILTLLHLEIKHQLFDCFNMEGPKFIFGRDKIVMLNIESFPDSLGLATAPRFFFHVLMFPWFF